MGTYELQVVKISQGKAGKVLTKIEVSDQITIEQLKKRIDAKTKINFHRQSLREGASREFKNVKDSVVLADCKTIHAEHIVYLKDLGPQISWKLVFITEYAGPLVLYAVFYFRLLPWIYGLPTSEFGKPSNDPTVKLAMICHSLHYLKREFETLFIHRFSNGTMPLRNIFKNSSYYWGFGLALGYFINHPLYTAPPEAQTKLWTIVWAIMEFGNFSIHVALKNLRPPGTKIRKVPMPTSNPFTWLFALTTCPNYTYEVAGWVAFTLMTNCAMGGVFTVCGFLQMMVWAKGKRRNYIKEFGTGFPKRRTAIVPFLI